MLDVDHFLALVSDVGLKKMGVLMPVSRELGLVNWDCQKMRLGLAKMG